MSVPASPSEPVTRYFLTWSGYAMPRVPENEVSKEEAQQNRSYYIATYEEDRLITFEKMLDGERMWFDTYEYWDETAILKTRTLTREDGSTTLQRFDEKGKIIKDAE